MLGCVPSPALAFKRDFPGCYNSPSTITEPIQKPCCLQRYTTACSKSVFQGTQSTEQTNAANGSIGTDIKPSRSAFSMPLSGRVSYAKLQCCAVYRGSCGRYSCICSCVSVACRGLFTGRRDIHFLSSRNAEYPSPNMWILPTISVVPRKRKKQKNVTLRGALIREQRMGLFLGKMAEQCVRSGSGVILNKTEWLNIKKKWWDEIYLVINNLSSPALDGVLSYV